MLDKANKRTINIRPIITKNSLKKIDINFKEVTYKFNRIASEREIETMCRTEEKSYSLIKTIQAGNIKRKISQKSWILSTGDERDDCGSTISEGLGSQI